MALPMFATDSMNGIIDAIERENVLYLKKFPKIGDKLARQIILDLKGKLVSNNDNNVNKKDYTELIEVLKGFGYKTADINKVLPQLDSSKSTNQLIVDALAIITR